MLLSCFRYHKGTDFQANHNDKDGGVLLASVVLDTTKVQIFKQITTVLIKLNSYNSLFQIPQRYRFSSKSQQTVPAFDSRIGCFRYHKGTDFQANHNHFQLTKVKGFVVLDTTKVQIFKQITTANELAFRLDKLFQIPQRYRFSSKSQPDLDCAYTWQSCFRYHKGTDFQANHNTV